MTKPMLSTLPTLCALASLCLCLFAVAPSRAAELPRPWELSAGFVESGNYLLPVMALQQHLDAYEGTPYRHAALEALGTSRAYVGDYAGAIEAFDRLRPPTEWGKVESRAEGEAVPALEAIAAEAGRHRVIMINEAHHVPQHRALTLQLLKALYARGFRYFAAETLSEDADLSTRGHALRTLTGAYTIEPLYGDLVRQALALGYRVIPYEDFSPCEHRPAEPDFCQNQRERIQAEQLRDKVFKRDPEARLLVHAGYGHIDEKGYESWVPMAKAFRQITGIDPFTVDQVEMREHSAAAFESPFYRNTLAQGPLTRPTLFRQPDGSYWTGWYSGAYDALVVSPRSRYRMGRPDWLLLDGQRKLQPLPADACKGQFPCLAQAFVQGESPEAVPMDQFMIQTPDPAALALPPGRFEIQIRDRAGQVIRTYPLEVKSAKAP